jgi:hypothetical protein
MRPELPYLIFVEPVVPIHVDLVLPKVQPIKIKVCGAVLAACERERARAVINSYDNMKVHKFDAATKYIKTIETNPKE